MLTCQVGSVGPRALIAVDFLLKNQDLALFASTRPAAGWGLGRTTTKLACGPLRGTLGAEAEQMPGLVVAP